MSWSPCAAPSTAGRVSCARSATRSCCRILRSARTSRGTRAGSARSAHRRCCCGPTTTRPAGWTRRPCCSTGCPTPACTSSRTPATGRSGRSATNTCACITTSCWAARSGTAGAVSEIIGMVGMSHSPFATMLPPPGPAAPGGGFLADACRVAAAVGCAGARCGGGHRPRPLPRELLRRDAAVRARRRGGRGVRGLRQPFRPAAGRVRPGLVDPRRAGPRRVRRCAVLRAHRRPRHRAELRHGPRRGRLPLVPLVVNTAGAAAAADAALRGAGPCRSARRSGPPMPGGC